MALPAISVYEKNFLYEVVRAYAKADTDEKKVRVRFAVSPIFATLIQRKTLSCTRDLPSELKAKIYDHAENFQDWLMLTGLLSQGPKDMTAIEASAATQLRNLVQEGTKAPPPPIAYPKTQQFISCVFNNAYIPATLDEMKAITRNAGSLRPLTQSALPRVYSLILHGAKKMAPNEEEKAAALNDDPYNFHPAHEIPLLALAEGLKGIATSIGDYAIQKERSFFEHEGERVHIIWMRVCTTLIDDQPARPEMAP